MNKLKAVVLPVIAALTLSIPNIVLAGPPTNAGYFPNQWYSDSGMIGYFPHSNTSPYTSLKVVNAYAEGCTMGSTLATVANAGFDSWASSLPVTRSLGTVNDYKIMNVGITRSQAQSLYYPDNCPAAAITWTSYTVPYYGTTSTGINKTIAQISKTVVYYIWDSTTQQFSIDLWKSIACHENGHALGYDGHDNGLGGYPGYTPITIMNPYYNCYWDVWHIKNPQTRDKYHIQNTYSKF